MNYETDQLSRYTQTSGILIDPDRSNEDKIAWNKIWHEIASIRKQNPGRFHPRYAAGFNRLGLSGDEIPTLQSINVALELIGWSAVYVDGMVTDILYRQMQSARIFPIARSIRKLRDLHHSAAPDFVHDVIGHLPMLFIDDYQKLMVSWASNALDDHPTEQDRAISRSLGELIDAYEQPVRDSEQIARKKQALDRLHQQVASNPSRNAKYDRHYAWSIELGLVQLDGTEPIIIGSAALSSPSELMNIIDGKTAFTSFAQHAIDTPVDYSTAQEVLFVAQGFSEYHAVLKSI
jgi:phenylalanine-4-hydroxylase